MSRIRPRTAPVRPESSQKIDRWALEYVSADGIPSQFTCWRSQEYIFSSVRKGSLVARAIELGIPPGPGSTPAMLLKSIGLTLASKGMVPQHMKAMRLAGNEGGEGCARMRCWKCGGDVDISAMNLVDLQIGSWPPGDQRRWRLGESWVVPALICPHSRTHLFRTAAEPSFGGGDKQEPGGEAEMQCASGEARSGEDYEKKADCKKNKEENKEVEVMVDQGACPASSRAPDSAQGDEEGQGSTFLPAAERGVDDDEAGGKTAEAKERDSIIRERSRMVKELLPAPAKGASMSCSVGDFRTIVGVYLEGELGEADGGGGGWHSIPKLLERCAEGTGRGLVEVPAGPCPGRVAVQVFNWMGMSGEDRKDKNYLPCRVYLTREARLVCRRGAAVGYASFNSAPDANFHIPALNAIYVMPSARGLGAARDLLVSFFRGWSRDGREEIAHEDGGKVLELGGSKGIEAPVSDALLAAFPKVLTKAEMRRIIVMHHGDKPGAESGTLLQLVEGKPGKATSEIDPEHKTR